MQKHSKWNWISGELIIRQIDMRTFLRGIFTSKFYFMLFFRMQNPSKETCGSIRTHERTFAGYLGLFSLLCQAPRSRVSSLCGGRNFISFGFAFSSVNLTCGLNFAQSRAHLPTHSGGLQHVFGSIRHGARETPVIFASNPHMECGGWESLTWQSSS